MMAALHNPPLASWLLFCAAAFAAGFGFGRRAPRQPREHTVRIITSEQEWARAMELMTQSYGQPEPHSIENQDGSVTIVERWPGTPYEIRRTYMPQEPE